MKKILLFTIVFCSLISCSDDNKKSYQGKRYVIEIAKDTVSVNEKAKALIHLAIPYFEKEKSKIVVFLEYDENKNRHKNLSNNSKIPIVGFHNLQYDTINQKWSSEKLDYKRTSAIGLKFKTTGHQYLKGFILEYYEGDPLLDKKFDYSKSKKHYFKEKIYVKE